MLNLLLQTIKLASIAIWKKWKQNLLEVNSKLEHIQESGVVGDERSCKSCETLQAWLDREIQEKEYLREVLFNNARLIVPEVVTTRPVHSQDIFQSTNKHIPFRVRRAKKEAEQRAKAKEDYTKPANPNELSEGERLFQQELAKGQ